MGLFRRRTRHRVGSRDLRRTYAPELNVAAPCWAHPSQTGSAPTSRLEREHLLGGLPAMVVAALTHVYPDLDRVIWPSTPRRGQEDARPRAADDHAHAMLRLIRGHGDLVDQPLREILTHPRCSTSSRASGQHRADPGAHRAGRPRQDRVGRDMDRLTETYVRGGATSPITATCSANTCCCTRCRRRWRCDGGRPVRRRPLRTIGPDGVADDAQPVDLPRHAAPRQDQAKVILGRRVERRPCLLDGCRISIGIEPAGPTATARPARSSRETARGAQQQVGSAAKPAGSSIVSAICSGACPKNTRRLRHVVHAVIGRHRCARPGRSRRSANGPGGTHTRGRGSRQHEPTTSAPASSGPDVPATATPLPRPPPPRPTQAGDRKAE